MAARHWTPEQRQRQREAIQKWKPWRKATGPKSAAGKVAASRNAWKGGHRLRMRQMILELNNVLRMQASGLP